MSLLTDLEDRLDKLPKKKHRKILAGSMRKYAALVTEAGASMRDVLDAVRFAHTVFPEEDFAKARLRVDQAVTLAAKLKGRLADDIEDVARKGTEEDVTRLREHANAARTVLRDRWKILLTARIDPHERLAEVVHGIPELASQGGTTLRTLLDRLRRQVTSPPETQALADSVREGLEDLPRVIEGLGLEGEVGEFLVQAAGGAGDPAKLYRPAMRDFFEGHDLLGLLRVSIR